MRKVNRKRKRAQSVARQNTTTEGTPQNKILKIETRSTTRSQSNASKRKQKKSKNKAAKSKKVAAKSPSSNPKPQEKPKADEQTNMELDTSEVRITRNSIHQKEILDLTKKLPESSKTSNENQESTSGNIQRKDIIKKSVGIQTFHCCPPQFPSTLIKYSAVDLFNLMPKITTTPKYKQYVEMMFHYVKKSHCLLLYKLLEKRSRDKPIWKETVDLQLGSGFLNHFIEKEVALKNCECTASEVILLVPEYNGSNMPSSQFLEIVEEVMKMVKNKFLKFLYFLIQTKLSNDVKLDSKFSKNLIQLWFKHVVNWDISLADIEAQYVVFVKHEQVSAVDASALIPTLCIKDDQTDECVMALGQYFKGVEIAVAAVHESELRFLYELARIKIKLADVYGRNVWLYTFPTLIKKLQSKFGRLETARYCQGLKEPSMKIEQLNAKDLIRLVPKLRPSVNNIQFTMSVFTAASMVKRKDLKFLYGLILQSRVLVYSNDDDFYTDSIENFTANFVSSISEDDECYSQMLSSIQFLASSLPYINNYHDVSDCYSAMDVLPLVPKIGKNNEMIPPFLNGVKYAESFVRKSELPFLRYLIKENIVGDYKHWINLYNVSPEETSLELTHMYNIVEFSQELLSHQR